MSPDGNEPGATWQGSTPSNQDESFDQSPRVEQDELAPPTTSQSSEALYFSSPSDSDEDSGDTEDTGDAEDAEQFSSTDSAPTIPLRLQQYALLLLLPLFFGIVAALAVLPAVASGRAQVPAEGFWPVAIALLIIALAQGFAVYYSGASLGLQVVSTLGGLYLFLLVASFSLFGAFSGLVLLVLLIVITILLVRLYVHPVPEGYVDIVYSFGKYSRTLYRGLNIVFPWEKVTHQLNVEESQWVCPLQRVQLSRDEDVILRATISYQVMPEDAYLAVSHISKWEESLHELFLTTIQSIATTFTPDDFLAWQQGFSTVPSLSQGLHAFPEGGTRWQQVNTFLFQQIRDKVALWGIQINWVSIRDVNLAPHETALPDPIPTSSSPRQHEPSEAAPSPKTLSSETAQPKASAPPPLAPEASASTPPRSQTKVTEEALKKAYKQVQDGNITDADTIYELAEKFEAVANDPELNQTVSFDAARAAFNLRTQAQKYAEQHHLDVPLYDDETKPDWTLRQPTDENLMAGG